MRKTLRSLVLGIAGALAGCPSGQVQQERTQSVAPVQSANIHSVAPVESAENVRRLVRFVKEGGRDNSSSGSDEQRLYDSSFTIGEVEYAVEIQESAKGNVELEVYAYNHSNWSLRDKYYLFRDTNLDGICDEVRSFEKYNAKDPRVQRAYVECVSKIIDFYERRKSQLESYRANIPLVRPSSEELKEKAKLLAQHAVATGRRRAAGGCNPYELFECIILAQGAPYKVVVEKLGDTLVHTHIELNPNRKESETRLYFWDDWADGECDSARFESIHYHKEEAGLDAQDVVQVEYERTLDKLVDAIKSQ